MIGYISGKIIGKSDNMLIVDVQGVGYKVYTLSDSYLKPEQSNTSFWTYLAVRETALDLYGFENKEELEMFELLLTVSGIGPKSALSVLENAQVKPLKQAIVSQNAALLTKTTGIGKKTAEKIVLELKGKITDEFTDIGDRTNTGEVFDALVSLGYSERQARSAYDKLENKDKTTEELIKEALKHIS